MDSPAAARFVNETFGLGGRRALVTGGSSGIGRAIALALAAAGAEVTIAARRRAQLEETVHVAAQSGTMVRSVVADVSDPDSLRALAAQAGEVDVLVNAAAINLRPPLAKLTEDDWRQTLATNLDAPHLLSQLLAPGMIDRGFGRLIHLSSQQAQRAFADSGAYGVSKAGLEALARSQSEAWARFGVTSNVLVPGFVLTPLNARLQADQETVDRLAQRTHVGRNGLPDDVAGPAVFLASAASAYVTGQAIAVDGGFSVH